MMSFFFLSMKELYLCNFFIYRKLQNISDVDNLSKKYGDIVESRGTMLFAAVRFPRNWSFEVI